CGRNISKETSSTIGMQRRNNYALRPMARDEFVTMMTTDLPEAPPYFARDAEINRAGARPLADLKAVALSPRDVKAALHRGTVVLDVREGDAFGAGHIGGAINIGLGGEYASWCGTIVPASSELVIVAGGTDHSHEAVIRLARVGMENVAGYLDGGILAWSNAGYGTDHLPQITARELSESGLPVLDVRRPAEFAGGHVPGAKNIPLAELQRRMGELDREVPLAVICGIGYRSAIATSLLARDGFASLSNVVGGTVAWIAEKMPVE
ncbi:MAG: rhodanese-like domain-containing protein, partial [Thermoanaerobaculia bacterium]